MTVKNSGLSINVAKIIEVIKIHLANRICCSIALLALLSGITGCSTSNPTPGYIGAIEQDRRLDADSLYKEDLKKKSRDMELCLMEKGRITQLQGDFNASRASFEEQVEILKKRELDDNTLPGVEINTGSVLVNDNMLPYKARLFEVEMIYLYQSFNYLAKGDLEGSVVEIRNADFLLNEAEKARASKDFKEEGIRNSESSIQKRLFENQKAIQEKSRAVNTTKTTVATATTTTITTTAPVATPSLTTTTAATASTTETTTTVPVTANPSITTATAVTTATTSTAPVTATSSATTTTTTTTITPVTETPSVTTPASPATPAVATTPPEIKTATPEVATITPPNEAKEKSEETAKRAEYEQKSKQEYDKSFTEMAEVLAKAKSSILNPYVLYVSGIIHEMNGEFDDAYIPYKQGLEVMPSNPYLQRDVVRLARKLNKTNDFDKLKTSFPELWKQYESKVSSGKDGRLIVLYESGWAPQKKEVFITIAAVAVAYPVYKFKWCEASPMLVSSELGEIGPTAPICYMNALALRALKEESKWRIIRQSARVAIKGGVFAAGTTMAFAGDNTGVQLAGVGIMAASAIYNNVSEKADLRCFMTLPENVQILAADMPAGTHKITFAPQGTQLHLEESVPVIAGKTSIIRVVQVGPRLIYQRLWPADPEKKSTSDQEKAQSNKSQEGNKT